MYKLKDFIQPDKLNIFQLCYNNSNAIYFIEKNLENPKSFGKPSDFVVTTSALPPQLLPNSATPRLARGKPLGDDKVFPNIFLNIPNIFWNKLSCYENAVPFLEKNVDKIDWFRLSQNPGAMHLLKKNPNKINWQALSSNKSSEAIQLLEKNTDKIHWGWLSGNPTAIHLLIKKAEEEKKINWAEFDISKEYPFCEDPYAEKLICWDNFSRNPNAVPYLEKNQDKIFWDALSRNPNAWHLIEQNINKYCDCVNNCGIFMNPNPNIILLIEKFYDKMTDFSWVLIQRFNPNVLKILERFPNIKKYWGALSRNPAAIQLMEQNQDKITWEDISANKAIFELDYVFLKERMDLIKEELIASALHPRRMARLIEQAGIHLEDMDSFI